MAGVKDLIYNLVLDAKSFVSGSRSAAEGVEGIGNEGQKTFSKLDTLIEKSSEQFGGLAKSALGVFGGGALIGAAMGLERAFDGVMEKGEEVLKTRNKMKEVFGGENADMKTAIANSEELANKYDVEDAKVLELSSNARLAGGATGEYNKNVTELAVGLEKLKLPGIEANGIVKAFTAGAGDAEGSEGMGRLTKAFPLLASGLAGITDPAEKAKKALEIMTPVLDQVAKDSEGPAEAGDRLKNKLTELQETIGAKVVPIIAGTFIPVLEFLVKGFTELVKVTDIIPGPVVFLAKVFGTLGIAIGVVTMLTHLGIAAKVKDFIITGQRIIQQGLETAARWLSVPAIAGQTIATTALSVATAILTSGMTYVIAGLVLLIMWLKHSYETSQAFRDAIASIGNFITKTLLPALGDAAMFFLKWLNPIGLIVQGLKALYDHIAMVKGVVDGAIGMFKSFGESLGLVKTKTEEAKDAQVKAAAEVIESLQKEQKAFEDYAKGVADTLDANRAKVDSSIKAGKNIVDANLQALGLTWEKFQEIDARVQKGLDSWTPKQKMLRDEIMKNVEVAREWVAKRKEMESGASGADSAIEEDKKKEKKVKQKRERDDALKILMEQFATEKDVTESAFKERSTLLDKQVASGLLTAEQGKIGSLLIEGEKTKALLSISEKYNAESKTILTEEQHDRLLALSQEKVVVGEHLTDAQRLNNQKIVQANATLKALGAFQLAESNAGLDHAKALAAQNQLSNDDEIAALKLHLAKMDAEFKKAHAQHAQDEQESRELRDAKLETSRVSAFNKDLQRVANSEADQLQALDDAHQATIDAEALYQAKRAEILATADTAQRKIELDALDTGHEAILTNEALFQARKTKVAADAAEKRYQIEVDNLTKNNLLYRAADTAFSGLLSQMTSQLKGFLDGSTKAKMETDKKSLAQDAKTNATKLASMQKDVAENKMSYQDYVDAKANMDQAYNDKKEALDQEGKVNYGKILTDTLNMFVDAGTKMLQEELQNTMKRIGIKQADAQAGATAGLFSSMPPFAALALEAGIMLAVSALFSAIAPKADAGIFVDNAKNGGRLVQMGEKRPEFAVTEQDFATYSQKRLTPMLEGVFTKNLMQSPQALKTFRSLQSGKMNPPVHPGVSRQATQDMQVNRKLVAILDKLHPVLTGLHEDGIKVDKMQVSGDHLEAVLRTNTKHVKNNPFVMGGGLR